MKQLSSGSTRAGQIMVIGIFAAFDALCATLLYRSFEWGGALALAVILGFQFFLGKNAWAFHDVYVADGHTFVLKHLFYTHRIVARDVRGVRAGVLPTSYCLVTQEREFYFSVIDLKGLATELTSLQTDTTLKALKQKVWQMQQAAV